VLSSAPVIRPEPFSFKVNTCPCWAPRGSRTFSTGPAASAGQAFTPKAKSKTNLTPLGTRGLDRHTLNAVLEQRFVEIDEKPSLDPKQLLQSHPPFRRSGQLIDGLEQAKSQVSVDVRNTSQYGVYKALVTVS